MGKKILEWGKTLLIVLLVFSLLVMILLTWIYDARLLDNTTLAWLSETAALFGLTMDSPPEAHPLIEANFVPVASPTKLAVTDSSGQTRGAAYNSAAVESVYNSLLDPLGRALRGMDMPLPITSQQWLEALGQPHVYLSYPGQVPLSVLGVWLGGGPDHPLDISALVLVREEEATRLYLKADDGYYTAYTNLPSAEWELPVTELPFCRYAFQLGWAGSLAYDNLIFESAPDIPLVRAGVAADLSSAEANIMQTLHFSASTHFQYVEENGTRVFVDGTRTLQFSPDGTAIYRNPTELSTDAAATHSLAEYVELAAELARPVASASRSGQLQLLSARPVGEARVVITFGLSVDGTMVLFPDRDYQTEVIFENGIISQMVCILRQYLPTDDTTSLLLPPRQVLRLLAEDPSPDPWESGYTPPGLTSPQQNVQLDIYYLDDTDGLLAGSWFVR